MKKTKPIFYAVYLLVLFFGVLLADQLVLQGQIEKNMYYMAEPSIRALGAYALAAGGLLLCHFSFVVPYSLFLLETEAGWIFLLATIGCAIGQLLQELFQKKADVSLAEKEQKA